MFDIKKKEIEWFGRKLYLETGRIARQADGAVFATYGNTAVLATAVAHPKVAEDVAFLPLGVHYQERSFAAGKIPGGFFKREGRPSEREVLVSRLIDRPIRPLFHKGFFNEVQVICTVLSHDMENDADVLSIIAASAALAVSGLPFDSIVGAAKIGLIDGEFVVNPTISEINKSDLDLIVAGTQEGVLMVESEAKELTEVQMLDAVMKAHEAYQPVIKIIEELAEETAKPKWESPGAHVIDVLTETIKNSVYKDLERAYHIADKQERKQALKDAKVKCVTEMGGMKLDMVVSESTFDLAFTLVKAEIVRNMILDGKRIDGRKLDVVRPITIEPGVLECSHGTVLFTRGETQALVAVTLGTAQDEQIIDALDGERKENFILHYNFPPFAVNEVGRVSSPGRREIGHGKLAWRALHPMIPDKKDFPYTIRVVSEITESNGSSSMASVCGGSLALMDAGVPLSKPVAGIAMGLVKEGEKFAVLTDILGDEDALGDMDFKVAGTKDGITALQMDIKITSITKEIMDKALIQAKSARMHILNEMNKVLSESKNELSKYAPKIYTMTIPKDKIRDVIGSGGKVIREICETTGAKIDISETGVINIAGVGDKVVKQAAEWIEGIVCEPEIGKIYEGKVVKLLEFGAIVEFMGNRDGMVHISDIREERVNKIEDELKVGDTVKVRVTSIDSKNNRIKLSMKLEPSSKENSSPKQHRHKRSN